VKVLLVGVRGHGGEEVYSSLLRDRPPAGVEVEATFDFHASCRFARCNRSAEVALNRLAHPFMPFNMGFRVLRVDPSVDLVHVHTHPTLLLGRRGRPVVFSAGSSHYVYGTEYEGWDDRTMRRWYGRARATYGALGILDGMLHNQAIDVAYTFSEWARRSYLQMGVPETGIRVLYPGFDIPAPAPRPERSEVTFLFMGRQAARKGGDLVLQAFARVRAVLPRAPSLRHRRPSPGPLEGVEICPLAPSDEVASIYAAADVFVNPPRAEGFGFTNAEAQGHGLPVISTRIGAVPEVVDDGRSGLLVPPNDSVAVAAAMRRLGEDAGLRKSMGEAARAHFERRFTLSVFQSGLGSLYEEARDLAARRGA